MSLNILGAVLDVEVNIVDGLLVDDRACGAVVVLGGGDELLVLKLDVAEVHGALGAGGSYVVRCTRL